MIFTHAFPEVHSTIEYCFECGTGHGRPMCWDDDLDPDLDICPGCGSLHCGDLMDLYECPIYLGDVELEPGSFQLARQENPGLYREVLPFYYEKNTFNHPTDYGKDANERRLTHHLNNLNDEFGRSKMLRNLHILIIGRLHRDYVLDWLKAREATLSQECKITLAGHAFVVMPMLPVLRLGERLRKHGHEWSFIEASLKDVSDAMEAVEEDDLEEPDMEYVEFNYAEDVLAKI